MTFPPRTLLALGVIAVLVCWALCSLPSVSVIANALRVRRVRL